MQPAKKAACSPVNPRVINYIAFIVSQCFAINLGQVNDSGVVATAFG